jgi:glycosyltransferase involved in cell wall biosynthesis
VRILIFMPRNMRFGPTNATSIDLCASELVSRSRYRDKTTIVCCENESLFQGFDIKTYPPSVDAHKHRKVAFAVKQARENSADVIVVHNHLPTAAALARRTSIPVILHKHNMTKAVGTSGAVNALRRRWKLMQYRSLGGLIFVSEFCRADFVRDWPEVRKPSAVVYNGLDFEEWQPAATRRKEIICVGRAAPEKGIKEAAEAIARVLEIEPSWSARLILSEPQRHPSYLQEALTSLQPVSSRVCVEYSQPLAVVRERLSQGAIAIVPSKWEEPFGRTALEAHAAGCAVISSGTGGLKEVGGSHAMFLPKNFGANDILDQLESLITDDAKRDRLAHEGRSYCLQRFSLASISNSADTFYERVYCTLNAGDSKHSLDTNEDRSWNAPRSGEELP